MQHQTLSTYKKKVKKGEVYTPALSLATSSFIHIQKKPVKKGEVYTSALWIVTCSLKLYLQKQPGKEGRSLYPCTVTCSIKLYPHAKKNSKEGRSLYLCTMHCHMQHQALSTCKKKTVKKGEVYTSAPCTVTCSTKLYPHAKKNSKEGRSLYLCTMHCHMQHQALSTCKKKQ